MKEKLKSINLKTVTNILKSSLIGVVASILLVLIFAFVLKFVDLNSTTISLVDQIIKILSIIIAVIVLNKINNQGLLIKGIIAGAVYSILTFLVFSILNGGINFTPAILTDLIFSALVGGVFAVFLNMIAKNK